MLPTPATAGSAVRPLRRAQGPAPVASPAAGHHADSGAEAATLSGVARWEDARLAAALLAINPAGLGGAHLLAPPGPARDHWVRGLSEAAPIRTGMRRMPSHADESRLLGGLDLTATLQAGRPVLKPGLLSEVDGGLLLCPMAERLPRRVVAHLCQALDHAQIRVEREGIGMHLPARIGVVALDEAEPDGEAPGLDGALQERLAFRLNLQGLDWRDCGLEPLDGAPEPFWDEAEQTALQAARARLPGIALPEAVCAAMVEAAWALGVVSLRAPWWAVQAAATLAALRGLAEPGADEVRDAARLVLGPRATQLPAPPADAQAAEDDTPRPPSSADEAEPPPTPADSAQPDDTPPPPGDEVSPPPAARDPSLEDLRVAAVQAALPAGLLALMAQHQGLIPRSGRSREASSRAGQRLKAGAQGRPSGTRPGLPEGGHRLSLIDTLRQAAPWQTVRRRALAEAEALGPTVRTGTPRGGSRAPLPTRGRVIVHRDDLRIVRREPRQPTTTVFVVDASGSNALNRLAEAKGAVETLLADCYVRRDRVAVLGFRGQTAETLLPPTRSLVRAKRSLAGLPGGGGTPMARALTDSRLLCESLRRRGDTVSLVLLTDGKSNVSLEGKPGREQAHADAVTAARQLFASGVACLLIDTSPKPQAQARELALAMGARYIPLPQARSEEIGRLVRNSRAA